jgi:hypothetical protein
VNGFEPGEDARAAQLRPEELLSVLQAHDVEFVVIGGFSLAVHGVVRATKDVDIVPDPKQENLRRLGGALDELEARIDLGDLDPSELGIELDAEGLGHGGNFVLYTRYGRLDVMQDVPGIHGGYARLRGGAVESEWPGISGPLLFAGYDALIAMKSAAGRDQDVLDIAALDRARGG